MCIYCGKEIEENDNVCENCKKATNNNTQNVVIEKKSEKFGTIGLFLSFSLNLFFCFIQFSLEQLNEFISFKMFAVAFFCCVLLLVAGLTFSVMGIISCKKNNKKVKLLPIVGLIFNLINIVISIIITYIFSFLIQIKN